MPEYKRLPRKLKKQLKKDHAEWQKYVEKKRTAKEKHESLNIIFTRNYNHSHRIFRKAIGIK
jgi:hypothetical protein